MKTVFLLTRYNAKADDGLPNAESQIYNSGIEKGVDMFPVFTDVAFIKEKEDGFYIYNSFDNFKKIKKGDIIYVRVSSTNILNGKSLFRHIVTLKTRYDLTILNPIGMTPTLSNKYSNYLIYSELGLNTPETLYIPNSTRLKTAVKQLGFPLVLKTVEGSMGSGVVLVESARQLNSIYGTLSKNGKIPLIAQEFFEIDGDVRVFCFGTDILSSMKRVKGDSDFRTNVSQGAKVIPYELNDIEYEEVMRLQQYFIETFGPIGTLGIDFMTSKDGDIIHIEINDSPGLKGINKVTEGEISDLLIDSLIKHYM